MQRPPDITVITPNWNGESYLERTLKSVLEQRHADLKVQYIVVDGASTDGSKDILNRYASQIDDLISEPDKGPASAINKGFARARAPVVAWLNADDWYFPGALSRALQTLSDHPQQALAFGRCRIVNAQNLEIRKGITLFKEFFFPFSCRFAIQSINYISQPSMFFRRSALEKVGPLSETLKAAWDYEFILRLWRQGGGVFIPGPPLAAFRWHASSISGTHFRQQFHEELEAAIREAGRWSPQAFLHRGVRMGIVGMYSLMARRRQQFCCKKES